MSKPESVASATRRTLEEVASVLDKALGDSDLTHIENDDELREVAPVQWACSQINRLLQTLPSQSAPMNTAEELRLQNVLTHYGNALCRIKDRQCTNPKPVGDSACECCTHHWHAIEDEAAKYEKALKRPLPAPETFASSTRAFDPLQVTLDIVRDVAEIPDRTSPDDQPEMMLVKDAELRRIVHARLMEALGTASAIEVGKWHKTSEGHPEGEMDVIALWKDEIGVAHHTAGHRWHAPDDDEDEYRAPDYWMLLPAKPNATDSATKK